MKPKQRRSRIIAITESYAVAFGLRYQGAFAEKDEETGYSAFALRQYDARFGRWTSTDPYGQYWSPYVGMGNMPQMGVDPDGGLFGLSTGWSIAAGAGIGFAVGSGVGLLVDGDNWWKYGLGGAAIGGTVGGITATPGRSLGKNLPGQNNNITTNPSGKLRYPSYRGWLEKTFYLDIDTYGLSAVTHSFRPLSLRFNPKYTKELNFTVNSANSIFNVERNGEEIFSNRDRRRELSTPNFRNGGERFTPVITHSFPPIEYNEVTEGYLAQVHVTALYRTVKIQRRVHRMNRAFVHYSSWDKIR